MEFLIAFLPALLIIFVIFKRIYDILREVMRRQEQELEEAKPVKSKTPSQDEGKEMAEEEEFIPEKEVPAETPAAKVAKEQRSGPSTPVIQARGETAVTEHRKSGVKLKFKQEDIVRGFIFKEVLDKPRSKKPYRPPYK